MSNLLFDSRVILGDTMPRFNESDVKNEPMLFSCDRATAIALGSRITHSFIESLPESWLEAMDLIVDTRVHMLMPGWFPCIPGWHHDDVPRTRTDGQPNYRTPEYTAKHAMALVGGDICPTEFALGKASFNEPQSGRVIYRDWHPVVDGMIRDGTLTKFICPSNKMVFFDWHSWHQGSRAVAGGWRWFGRATINTHRKPSNEMRRQVQVYLENPMDGW